MLKPIQSYVLTARRMSEEAFVSQHQHSVLVIQEFQALAETGFQTMAIKLDLQGSERVAVLRKREGANVFKWMLTIGRAGNNDVELKAAGVSKFHAYVLPGKDGGPDQIADAGSSFGTLLDGAKLAPKTPVALEPGQEVRFGEIKSTYFTPAAFYQHLLGRKELPDG